MTERPDLKAHYPKMLDGCKIDWHEKGGGCWNCCDSCNYDLHICKGCGEPLLHDGREYGGKPHGYCLD